MMNKGYTLLEIIISLSILIIFSIGVGLTLKNDDYKVRELGEEILSDLEYFSMKAEETPYSYQIYFNTKGYKIEKNFTRETSKVLKKVTYEKGMRVEGNPTNILFDDSGKKNIGNSRTIKVYSENSKSKIYITIVPESNRMILTKNPSNEIWYRNKLYNCNKNFNSRGYKKTIQK